MKKLVFLVSLFWLTLALQAQPIRYASDAAPIIAHIDSVQTIKQYEGVLGDSYSYVFTADATKHRLLKAVVQDKQSNSTISVIAFYTTQIFQGTTHALSWFYYGGDTGASARG